MSDKLFYRWRVIEEGPNSGPWKMKGKVLNWEMTEESAKAHERDTGRKLERVGQGTRREPVGDWSTPPMPTPGAPKKGR